MLIMLAHVIGNAALLMSIIYVFRGLRMDLTVYSCSRTRESATIIAISLVSLLILSALLIYSCVNFYKQYILS